MGTVGVTINDFGFRSAWARLRSDCLEDLSVISSCPSDTKTTTFPARFRPVLPIRWRDRIGERSTSKQQIKSTWPISRPVSQNKFRKQLQYCGRQRNATENTHPHMASLTFFANRCANQNIIDTLAKLANHLLLLGLFHSL